MKKLILLFSLAIFISPLSFAQNQLNNSVKLNVDGFYIPEGNIRFNMGNQLGITYEHRIVKNFYAAVGYHKWIRYTGSYMYNMMGYYVNERVNDWYTVNDNGTESRFHSKALGKVQMVDISVLYKLQLTSRQKLSVGVAGSYFWGQRTDSYEYAWIGGDTGYGESVTNDVSGMGIVPQLSYDYSILKNRLSLGADIRARYYTKRLSGQYDYGFHVGVNF